MVWRRLAAVLVSVLGLLSPARVRARPVGRARPPAPTPATRSPAAAYALRSSAAGKVVAKSGGGYAASSPQAPGAEPFYLKATALGSYMLYGRGATTWRVTRPATSSRRPTPARTPTGP